MWPPPASRSRPCYCGVRACGPGFGSALFGERGRRDESDERRFVGLQSLASAVIATGSTAQAPHRGLPHRAMDRRARSVRPSGQSRPVPWRGRGRLFGGMHRGVTSLALIGIMPWRDYPFSWWIWWTGDAVGVVSLTPLFLTWRRPIRIAWSALRIAEAATLFALLAAVSFAIFGELPSSATSPPRCPTSPFHSWCGVRFVSAATEPRSPYSSSRESPSGERSRGKGPSRGIRSRDRWYRRSSSSAWSRS